MTTDGKPERIFKAAKAACLTTNAVLSRGPSNSLGNAIMSVVFGSTEAIKKERDIEEARKNYPKAPTKSEKGNPAFFLTFNMFPEIEKGARSVRTGTCAEFAVTAFQNLVNVHNVTTEVSIELVGTRTKTLGFEFNHWIVVLDRDGAIPLRHPDSWNEDAIICDAWRNTADYVRKYKASHWFEATSSLRMPDDNPGGHLLIPANWKAW